MLWSGVARTSFKNELIVLPEREKQTSDIQKQENSCRDTRKFLKSIAGFGRDVQYSTM